MKDVTISHDTASSILDSLHSLECSIENRMLEEMKRVGKIIGATAYIEHVDNWGRWIDGAEDMAAVQAQKGIISDNDRLSVDMAADYLLDCDEAVKNVRSLQRQLTNAYHYHNKPIY